MKINDLNLKSFLS